MFVGVMPSGQDADHNGKRSLSHLDRDADSPESGEIDGASMDSGVNSFKHSNK